MLYKAFLTALSAYSVIPARVREWDDRAMKYSLMFFPVIGVIIGLALFVWNLVCDALPVSNFFFALIAACIPLFITGGIHVDGFMDTVDAVSSHQSRERKLEILKDSHPGAFAVIWLLIYMLICTGLYYELGAAGRIIPVIPVFVLSRALSAANVSTLPNARGGGMLYAYTKDLVRRKTFYLMLAVAAAAVFVMIFTGGIVGLLSAAAGGISVLLYRRFVMKTFGGTTGDTAGFFLQVCEGACLFGAFIGSLF